MTVIAIVDSFGYERSLPQAIVQVPKGKTGEGVFSEWLRQREIEPERKTHVFYEYEAEII